MTVTKEQLQATLAHYRDPYLGQDLVSAKAIGAIDINGNQVTLTLVLGYPALRRKLLLEQAITELLLSHYPALELAIKTTWKVAAHAVQSGLKGTEKIKNIIAVASGKGGVGKSTTAVNLALALAAEGAAVGILDADIYGPSQPHMLGATSQPVGESSGGLTPVVRHGIQSMSIGYLIDQTSAVVWRGPMVSGALQQLLHDTAWNDLDYLIVDLPPGTGDIQLTLAQKIPVSGAVIVTTPQDIALLDARRAIAMFNKVNVPVLGIVENMSQHVCTHCGHRESIFGEGGGQSIAEQYEVPLLGKLPLDRQIQQQADGGNPTVVADPCGDNALIYRDIACHVAARLSLRAKDYSSKFPNIEIQNT